MTKRRITRALAALLAALTLLSLAACGDVTVVDVDTDSSTTVQQTDEQKKNNTAKSGNKTDGKTGSKTDDTKKDNTATDGTTTDKDGKKTDTSSDSQNKPAVTDNGQQGTTTSGDKDTSGKDNSGKTETPASPTRPETPSTPSSPSCTISISCGTILNNMDMCRESKKGYVPSNGTILSTTTVTFEEGETVYDVLQRVCRDKGIQMDASWTAAYNSAYVKGIGNLYEFDVGEGSGWMYKVNGWFPNYGCSSYDLQDGDTICWVYTCDLGDDVGGGYMG